MTMTTIILMFLCIVQIITFYFLALLYTKVTKFDDLEKKQRKLMTEMDDSIGAYLSELKDENERLLEQLTVHVQQPALQKTTVRVAQESAASEEGWPEIRASIPKMPVNLALKSYKSAVQVPEKTLVPVEVDDDRTKAIRLHDEGKSIEEIAKQLGKGRTEIELILKFR